MPAFQSSFNSLSRPQLGVRGRAATTGQHHGSYPIDEGFAPQAISINVSPDTPGFSSPTGRYFAQGSQEGPTTELRIAAPAAPPPWSMGYGTSDQDVSSFKTALQADDHDVVMGEEPLHDSAKPVYCEQESFRDHEPRMMGNSRQLLPDSTELGIARMAPSLTLDMSFKAFGHLSGAFGTGGVGTSSSSPTTTMPSTPFPVATSWAGQQTQPEMLAASATAAPHMRSHDHSLHVQVERVASNAKDNLVDAAVAEHHAGVSGQVAATLSGDSWGTAGTTIDPKLVSPLKSTWSSPTATRATTPLLQAAASRTAFLSGGPTGSTALLATEAIAKPAASPPDFANNRQSPVQTLDQRLAEPSGLSLAGPVAGLPPAPPPPLRRASDSDTPPTVKSAHGFFPGDGTQSFPPR